MSDTKPELFAGSKQRAATCARLFLAGKTKSVVFTGSGPSTQELSVAELMAQHAKELGVPETAIFVETVSRSTLQNALFSLPKISGAKSVRIVTDSFHLPRSWISFRWAGYPDLSMHPSQSKVSREISWKNFQPVLREPLAIWFNLVRLPVYSAAKAMQIPNADRILL